MGTLGCVYTISVRVTGLAVCPVDVVSRRVCIRDVKARQADVGGAHRGSQLGMHHQESDGMPSCDPQLLQQYIWHAMRVHFILFL